jgi:hypothetical protein
VGAPKALYAVDGFGDDGPEAACGFAGALEDQADVVEAFGLPAKVGLAGNPEGEFAVSASGEDFMRALVEACGGALKLRRLCEKKESMLQV